MQLNKLKDNKPFLIAILLISIIGLGYIGINVFMASFVGDSTSYAWGHIKLSEYKQDGSRNMEVIMGEPHDLEFYVVPFADGSVYEYMFMWNAGNRAEVYRVTIYPTDYAPGYFTIPMATASPGPWMLEYWEKGSVRSSETYMMSYVDEDSPFTLTAYNISREDDYCEGTTLYNNGTYFMGDVFFDEHINSEVCGYVPDPCEGITCEDYCENTTSHTNGICLNGTCNYDVEFNSTTCGYDPCFGIICEDYCKNTTSYFDGECIDGVCNYDENLNSSDCGYIVSTGTSDSNDDTILDDILDLFEDEPAPSSSSSSSEPSATPSPVVEELITEPEEDTNSLSDFLQWIRDLINKTTGI